jgi:hypothetical protein
MDRRLLSTLVLFALLAVLGGCAHPSGMLSMQPVEDADLAEEGSRALPETDDTRPGFDSGVARRAVENGSATATAPRPPVEPGLPFRHDGRFYNLSYTVTGTTPGYSTGIEIDYNASSVEGSVIAYEDLPAVDRERVEPLVTNPRERREPGYDFGVGVVYTEREAESSVLVTEQEYDAIRYRGETYPIRIEEPEQVEFDTYRYEATVVADSAETYGSFLREEYAFTLSGLSDAEQSVVDEAANGTYYAGSSDEQGFASLVERFRSRRAVESDEYGGSWVVRYDGQLYWAEMDYGAFAGDDDTVTRPEETPPPEQ